MFILVVIVDCCERDILDVVGTLRAPGGFAGGLDCWKQECDQNADNGDDDEQFDQREPAMTISIRKEHVHGCCPRFLRAQIVLVLSWSPQTTACSDSQ